MKHPLEWLNENPHNPWRIVQTHSNVELDINIQIALIRRIQIDAAADSSLVKKRNRGRDGQR